MFITSPARALSLLGVISTLASASPVPTVNQRTSISSSIIGNLLCSLPVVRKLCGRDTGEVNVLTAVGTARGLQTSSTSSRFVVKYASATRWGLPTKANAWDIPSNDINKMPPMCPQPDVDASSYSEDCLYMAVYAPSTSPNMLSSLPVLVWIHGGSFEVGSASAAGLDGAALAKATNSIVVVPQYRLGALGLVPPSSSSGNTNLAVRDMITCLQFIRQVLPSFGGDINKITVAGQSSGGHMVRALLASPSSYGLFNSAGIHSDTMDYGFYKPETVTNLQTQLYTNSSDSLTACNNDLSRLQSLPVSDIISAQQVMRSKVQTMYPVTFSGSPIRPFHDGQLLQYTLTGSSFPSAADMKPLLIMTVKDEGGSLIGSNVGSAVPDAYLDYLIEALYPDGRSSGIIASNNYAADTYAAQAGVPAGDVARAAVTQLVTDSLWRCPSWTFSRNWASKGGTVYTGEFQTGATYTSNSGIAYCSGKVCHEDDIYPLFGTTPSPTSAQTALTQEIQARYSSFIRSAVPNPSSGSYSTWAKSGGTDVAALKLGGTGTRAAEACDPSFWGVQIPYSYQMYGL